MIKSWYPIYNVKKFAKALTYELCDMANESMGERVKLPKCMEEWEGYNAIHGTFDEYEKAVQKLGFDYKMARSNPLENPTLASICEVVAVLYKNRSALLNDMVLVDGDYWDRVVNDLATFADCNCKSYAFGLSDCKDDD